MAGQDQSPSELEVVLPGVEQDLSGDLDQESLRRIRNLLDDVTLLPQLRELLARRHNDPQMYEIPNRLIRMMRMAEELRDQRETDRGSVTQLAIGGSTGLLVGSIIASLNPVIGLLAFVPAVGGILMAGAFWLGVRRLDKEKTLFTQIADRLSVIVKAIV